MKYVTIHYLKKEFPQYQSQHIMYRIDKSVTKHQGGIYQMREQTWKLK